MSGKVLIAGGSGLVGANLAPALREAGWKVAATRFQNRDPAFADLPVHDLTDFDTCCEITRGQDAVVLAAGLVAGTGFHREQPTAAILPNLQINAGLLEACAGNGVPTAVLLSSTTVYPALNHPAREEEGEPGQPLFPGYQAIGSMYRYLESLARSYTRHHGMRIVILRPTSIYGPFDTFDPDRSHVTAALIRRALTREDPFVIWGTPGVTRDFIYVGDLVQDIVRVLADDSIPDGLPVNIGRGEATTIAEAADVILEACDHQPEVRFDPERPTAIPHRSVNTGRYRELFGDQQRTDFRTGIRATVEWYRARTDDEGEKK